MSQFTIGKLGNSCAKKLTLNTKTQRRKNARKTRGMNQSALETEYKGLSSKQKGVLPKETLVGSAIQSGLTIRDYLRISKSQAG